MSEFDTTLFTGLLDALDTGIIVIDNDRRVVFWNDWIAHASGIAPDAANGRLLDELFPPSSLRQIAAVAAASFEAETASLITHSLHRELLPLTTRSGHALTHDIVVRTLGPKPYRYCLIQIADVTAAATRERVLRARQDARYSAVVDHAPDVILTLDANGTIRFANPATEGQFGYQASEILGRPMAALFRDPQVWDNIWHTLSNRLAFLPVEVAAVRKDGSLSHMEVSASRWLNDGRVFVSAILRDVNERHEAEEALRALNATLEQRIKERTDQLMQAEEKLRQSQKMEAVGRLTGGIAHDFNNLLQGIIGPLDLVQKRVTEGRIGDVDRFVQGALRAANRAASLTHRLLAFSRQQAIDPRPLDVNRLIATIEELLRRTVGEATQMRLIAERNLWLVRCDPNQLESSLLNLTINARDAMRNGGTLTIETANVVLDAEQALQRELSPGEYVRISVRDTGIGMTADVAARAFDPFYTTKPIGEGTGLGLSMIYGFVRQSNGSTLIESEVGLGTMVEICLPRFYGELIEVSDMGHAKGIKSARGAETVLVVEDEGNIRVLIVEILNDLGYQVLEAADGPAALRIVQSAQRIDLLVTDVGLPGLNGRQVADAARVNRPNLKVLFMTGYAERAADNEFLEAGMEVIPKPFTMETLAGRISAIIDRL
jgi:PAS domain S-box-containing protein